MKWNKLSEYVKAIGAYCPEVTIMIGGGQLKAIGYDLSNSMVGCAVIPHEGNEWLGTVNAAELSRALKSAEAVSFGNTIMVKSGKRMYRLPVTETFQKPREPPQLQPATTFTVDLNEIKKSLKEASGFMNKTQDYTVTLGIMSGQLVLKVTDDVKKYEEVIDVEELSGSASCTYSARYLSEAVAQGGVATVGFGMDYPITITCEEGSSSYFVILAPRVGH